MNLLTDSLKVPSSSISYLPLLDTVRAFAVSLVLWHHWYQPRRAPGPIGVWIFFVLSGFLITRILLKSRRDTAAENQLALRNFYIRRFLRIFPLYYFLLIVAFATSTIFRADWAWYATYLQNFMMILAEKDKVIFGSHLWSLAVEEQFYVVWPLIALFAPRRTLLPIITLAVLSASVTRYFCAGLGWTPFKVYVFTPSNLDTLGFGALLAYFVTYRPQSVVLLRRMALLTGVAILAGAVLFKFHVAYSDMLPLPMGLISLWIVSVAADGVPGILGRIAAFPPLIYMGRISYGIYVYHYFVPIVLRPLFDQMKIAERDPLFLLICFVVTMVVASLSWILMEKPINSLKDRFAGDSPPARAKSSAPHNELGGESECQLPGT